MRVTASLAVLSAAAILVSAGAVSAGDQGRPTQTAANGRPVLVCATDAATRRAFTRDHGARPVFITAREALSVRPTDPTWDAPRCMTAREHARYVEAANTYASAR